MRNRYPCRCIECRKRIPANGGDYIGWMEGLKGPDGIRRGSGYFGICDSCKAKEQKSFDEEMAEIHQAMYEEFQTVEAPAVARQGLGDGATMSTVAPSIAERGEKSNG